MSKLVVSGVLLTATLALAGCQTAGEKSLSLEEAKQVTGELSQPSTAPPPRTIDDLLGVLEQRDEIPAGIERDRATISTPVPADIKNNRRELALHYYEKGNAARRIGLAREEVAAYRRATELADALLSADTRSLLFRRAAWAELKGGKLSRFLPLLDEALKSARFKGPILSSYAHFHAIHGDFEKAAEFAEETKTALSRARSPWRVYHINRPLGLLALYQGHWEEAERYFRVIVNSFEGIHNLDQAPEVPAFVSRQLALALLNQGRPVEAEAVIRQGLDRLLRHAGSRVNLLVGNLLRDYGKVLIAQERLEEADLLTEMVRRIDTELGLNDTPLVVAGSLRFRATVDVMERRFTDAVVHFRRIEEVLAPNADLYRQHVLPNADRLLAYIGAGLSAEILDDRVLRDHHPASGGLRELLAGFRHHDLQGGVRQDYRKPLRGGHAPGMRR